MPVTLGAREYRVVPQGIGRIRRKLVALIDLVDGLEGVSGEIDSELHELLKTFIPDIVPLHELLGYDTAEAYREGGEPEGAIAEATLPQILDALETVYKVNGADRLVRLGKGLGGTDLIKTLIRREVANWALERSPSLPAPSGESDSTSSTTTDPASEPSAESQFPDSSTSSNPESPAAVMS
jgi:hypothetical protein